MHIIVADEEAKIRGLIALFLSGKGHEVSTASTGDGLVGLWKQTRSEVVLCGAGLPGLPDAIRACEAIRAADPSVRLFLMTGTAESRILAAERGFEIAFDKPFASAEVERWAQGLAAREAQTRLAFSHARKLSRMMIVDDDEDYTALLRQMLSPLSERISIYNNGESALSLAASEQPDVILLDIFLLGIHGLYALARLKADPATAHIPVVIMSSLRSASFKRLALEAGAADVLSKNLPLQEVMNRILESARPDTGRRAAALN